MATGARRKRQEPPQGGPRRAAPKQQSSRARLTLLGAMLAITGCGVLGALIDGLFGNGLGAITGIAFAVGCLLAVLNVRPNALLALVVTPPLLFFCVIVASELVRTWGSSGWLRNIALGLTTSLSIEAPWLFLGTGLVLAVAWARGLLTHIRELRERLRPNVSPNASPDTKRSRRAARNH